MYLKLNICEELFSVELELHVCIIYHFEMHKCLNLNFIRGPSLGSPDYP